MQVLQQSIHHKPYYIIFSKQFQGINNLEYHKMSNVVMMVHVLPNQNRLISLDHYQKEEYFLASNLDALYSFYGNKRELQ